jgi:hypothetical protein
MENKVCKTCKVDKSLEQFQRRKLSVDGYDLHCKICKNEYNKKYRKVNRTTEKSKLESIKWPKNKNTRKNWNILNKEKIKLQRKSIIENYSNEEYKEFREKYNKWRREKGNNEPLFRLKNNLRTTIWSSIKRCGYKKYSKTYEILGCSYNDFIVYLESKFESWMTWENYGRYNGELYFGWDIDHIVPVKNAKTEQEIININHYTNLQPLCSKINRDIKKDKLNYEDKRI